MRRDVTTLIAGLLLICAPAFTTYARMPADGEETAGKESALSTIEGAIPKTWEPGYRSPEDQKAWVKGPNVHRTVEYCGECHGAGVPAPANLRNEGDDVALCRTCHPRSVYHVHVVNIKPDKVVVPEAFPLVREKMTCATCHDEPSCNAPIDPSWERPFFLRGTKVGYQFCFECHRADQYKPYNPHDPIHLATPQERRINCLFCHTTEIPVEARKGIEHAALKGEPNALCSACHLEEPHFGIPAHLRDVGEEALSTMKEAAEEAGPWLPLGANYAALCVSCHEPHIPGLIRAEEEQVDKWLQGAAAGLRLEFLQGVLHPFLSEEIEAMEEEEGRKLVIRHPDIFLDEPRGMMRFGLQEEGSLCLWCHNVFEEEEKEPMRFRVSH